MAGGGAGPSLMGDTPDLLERLTSFRVVFGGSQGGDATAMARAAALHGQQLPSDSPLAQSTIKSTFPDVSLPAHLVVKGLLSHRVP